MSSEDPFTDDISVLRQRAGQDPAALAAVSRVEHTAVALYLDILSTTVLAELLTEHTGIPGLLEFLTSGSQEVSTEISQRATLRLGEMTQTVLATDSPEQVVEAVCQKVVSALSGMLTEHATARVELAALLTDRQED